MGILLNANGLPMSKKELKRKLYELKRKNKSEMRQLKRDCLKDGICFEDVREELILERRQYEN